MPVLNNLDSSYYYTLSTIAQVLAAFLALSGIFVIRRIDILNKSITDEIKTFLERWYQFIGTFKQDREIYKFIYDLKYHSLSSRESIKKIRSITTRMDELLKPCKDKNTKDDIESGKSITETYLKRINLLYNLSVVLITLTTISVLIGLFSIFTSIIFLTQIPYIYLQPYSYLILVTTVSSCFISLTIMFVVILLSILDNSNESIMFKFISKNLIKVE